MTNLSKKKRVYANSNVLFTKRLYSPFNLCMKYIKLRDSLEKIITSFDIYYKKQKYENIFETFMQLGSIPKAPDLNFIAHSDLFPVSEVFLNSSRILFN